MERRALTDICRGQGAQVLAGDAAGQDARGARGARSRERLDVQPGAGDDDGAGALDVHRRTPAAPRPAPRRG